MTNQIASISEIRKELTDLEPQFKLCLPPQISPERFVRVVLTAIQGNSSLLSASKKSLFESCMKCAADGLLPDGKEAALVIYNTKVGPVVQYIPMFSGILKKVRNSGELASIASEIVFENDQFKYWVDNNGANIEHEPLVFGDRGGPKGVYAVAKTKDGATYVEVMSKDQVYDVRDVSKAKSGPWDGPFEAEMWRKTVIRRLSKRLPMSTDLEQVIRRDDEMFDFKHEPDQKKAKALEQMIGKPELIENKTEETSQGFNDFSSYNQDDIRVVK